MLNKRAAVFYRVKILSRGRVILDPSLLNTFKDISRKACISGVDNSDTFVNVRN